MTKDNLQQKKKRITCIATSEGVEKAEKALKRLGFDSKENFANSIDLSRTTVTNFFSRKPIQLSSFKRICQGLTFEKWQYIAELPEEINAQQVKETRTSSVLSSKEGIQTLQTPIRKITVVDANNIIKVVITLQGDINSNYNLKALAAIIKEYSGNTIEIIDVQEGSIKLTIQGSKEDIERLLLQINSGKLTEIDGFAIENIQLLSESAEDDESSEQKWRLVKEIRRNSVKKRNLSGIDLSDADLSGADLRDADLSGADLSGADLRGAYLRGADLSGANLGDANLRGAYLRGADLSGADLSGANLGNANLRGADLRGADLRGANLRGVNLSRANLSGADLRGTNLSGANLSDTNLSDTNLSDADLSGANLSDAFLGGANLSDAFLGGANLSGANLNNAQIKRTQFGANLGISEGMKQDLIKRGAIFEDFPGDRSGILSPH